MSTRLQLALLLFAIVLGTLALAWVLTGRAVLVPFTQEVQRAYLDQIAFLADEIEAGKDPDILGRRLGLDVRITHRVPGFVRHENGPRGPCKHEDWKGRRAILCRGPRAPSAIALNSGWMVVRRDLDVAAPPRRFGFVLLIVAAIVLGGSAWIAVRITRPLRTSALAMERIASGDLKHRLTPRGGKEFTELALSFNKMADRVDALLRAERELMAGISHELRTPLARLRLETEILRDHEVPEKRLAAMESDLEEIDRLIGEILELSRLSIGERPLRKGPVDLYTIAEEAIRHRPLPEHEVILDGTSAKTIGDHDRLMRVVGNLLENAGKYAPKGSRIIVRVGAFYTEILDEGPGVPPGELAHVFEPFFRGERHRSATGLGLGLMIAKQIITMHDGQISATNREGGGFTIRFELPGTTQTGAIPLHSSSTSFHAS